MLDRLQGLAPAQDQATFVLVLIGISVVDLVLVIVIAIAFGGALALLLIGLVGGGMAAGALLGFLFGLPRFTPGRSAAAPGPARSAAGAAEPSGASGALAFRPSTPMDEIADWLTKIIVGVGLVQLRPLYHAFLDLCHAAGVAVGPSLQIGAGGDTLAAVLTGTTLTFHVVFGLVMSFTYCRLHLSTAITRVTLEIQAALDAVGDLRLTRLDRTDREALPGDLQRSAASLARLDPSVLKTAAEHAAWGKAQAVLGNFRSGAEAYRRAVALDTENPRYWRGLGYMQRRLCDYKAAVSTFQIAQQIAEKDERELQQRILIDQAIALLYLEGDGPARALAMLEILGPDETVVSTTPRVLALRASAHGLLYRQRQRELELAGERPDPSDATLAKHRAGALHAVRVALSRLEPTNATVEQMRRMMIAGTRDSDLAVFNDGQDDFKPLMSIPLTEP